MDQFGQSINLSGLPFLPYSLDYQRDLQPWIGSTAVIALLPLTEPESAQLEDHLVMAVAVTDRDKRDRYLKKLEETLQRPPVTDTYQDVPILVWPVKEGSDPEGKIRSLSFDGAVSLPLMAVGPQENLPSIDIPLPLPTVLGNPGVAIALLGDVLVAAENAEALKQFLDQRPQKASSLADQAQFQRTLDHPRHADAFVSLYGNLIELLNYSVSDINLPDIPLPTPPPSITPEFLEMLRASGFGGSLEALAYLQREGLRLQGRIYYDESPWRLMLTPNTSANDRLLALLPAPTYMLVSGRNLAAGWRRVALVLETLSEATREGLEFVRAAFNAATGLDLDQDVFGWMDGEAALFAFPSELSPLTLFDADAHLAVGVMLQTSDRATAETTLETLLGFGPFLNLSVVDEIVNGVSVSGWDIPASLQESVSIMSYGWVSEDTLTIATGAGPMERLMNPVPFDPLSDHGTFRAATAGFPQPNNGYFYLNAGSTLLLIYRLFDWQDDLANPYEVTDYLGTLRSLSMTTAVSETFFEVDGLLGLASLRAMQENNIPMYGRTAMRP